MNNRTTDNPDTEQKIIEQTYFDSSIEYMYINGQETRREEKQTNERTNERTRDIRHNKEGERLIRKAGVEEEKNARDSREERKPDLNISQRTDFVFDR